MVRFEHRHIAPSNDVKIDIYFFREIRFGNRCFRQCALLFTLYLHSLLALDFFLLQHAAIAHMARSKLFSNENAKNKQKDANIRSTTMYMGNREH